MLAPSWNPDLGNGTYRNPVLYADYSDPDVIRHGQEFYLVASSFNCLPGLPVLHSHDLVNWTILNHVYNRLPSPEYDLPALGKGSWAPSIRYHDGKFWVFFAIPDDGIFLSTATDPGGAWAPLHLVHAARGWIDTCPFWDDDGQAYLVNAFAASRAGFNSVLQISRMRPDGTALLEERHMVFDGHQHHPTIEGPKLYKRNGYYYIFAPAGGVPQGWQTVLRSRHIFGPYEDRVVLRQGRTKINGPHQGAWVELESGQGWFLHFQDQGAYGRVVHLQPLRWEEDWPVVGQDGEPVETWRKPDVGHAYPPAVPQTSDEFDAPALGRQWQWQANPRPEWYSLRERPGHLRLYAQPSAGVPAGDLCLVPNLLMQKFPAPAFTATAQVELHPRAGEERAGLAVVGRTSAVSLAITPHGVEFTHFEEGESTRVSQLADLSGRPAWLRVTVRPGAQPSIQALCQFSYSLDGLTFTPLGEAHAAQPGRWIGAKMGLFCLGQGGGRADIDWFRVEL